MFQKRFEKHSVNFCRTTGIRDVNANALERKTPIGCCPAVNFQERSARASYQIAQVKIDRQSSMYRGATNLSVENASRSAAGTQRLAHCAPLLTSPPMLLLQYFQMHGGSPTDGRRVGEVSFQAGPRCIKNVSSASRLHVASPRPSRGHNPA